MTEERDDIVVLIDENGEEVEFEHLDTIEMNENRYVILLPVEGNEDDEEEAEVVILKVAQDEDNEDILVPVEDDDELNEVFDEFKAHMEDEYDFVEDDE